MSSTQATARRAILPEVMLAEDVALALGVPVPQAHCLMAGGVLGPCRQIGSRLYVTREGLLASIAGASRPASTRPIDSEVAP